MDMENSTVFIGMKYIENPQKISIYMADIMHVENIVTKLEKLKWYSIFKYPIFNFSVLEK